MYSRIRENVPELKKTSGDAGFDVTAYIDRDFAQHQHQHFETSSHNGEVQLAAGQRALFPTGLILACDANHYWRIAPRSGLAYHYGVDVLAGVVDSCYRQEVKVILFNSGRSPVTIKHGDRIAQIILESCSADETLQECKDLGQESSRAGFGSSGR